MSTSPLRLDDLYKMIAHIYGEQNAHRPASATFTHFLEVCGMLTVHSRNKKREGVTFVEALCKALGWYFPLMAKFKVSSVEELVFRKYPAVILIEIQRRGGDCLEVGSEHQFQSKLNLAGTRGCAGNCARRGTDAIAGKDDRVRKIKVRPVCKVKEFSPEQHPCSFRDGGGLENREIQFR